MLRSVVTYDSAGAKGGNPLWPGRRTAPDRREIVAIARTREMK
jgi:hypothetical protein